eukprot:Tbor_TRINITY_DN5837_c1_g4::TRINITY_DN5837_c1_g4_i1::g.7331::m.7331/K00500/phhA, PAH; phenylalanine-4-hydroxylase
MRRTLCLFMAETKKSDLHDQFASTGSGISGGKGREQTSLSISLHRKKVGSLMEMLKPFAAKGINIQDISNRVTNFESQSKYMTMYVDCDSHISTPEMKAVLADLKVSCPVVSVIGSWKVPWYPTSVKELDLLDQNTLAAGSDIKDDPSNPHPGFHDEEYKARRKLITESAKRYKTGMFIETIEYTQREIDTWTTVWDKLVELYPTHACRQFNNCFPLFIENGVFSREHPPQLQHVSDYLQLFTGYTVRPVAGLLSTRDFLNALAFRVFFSTQYLRHHSKPLYTPEPDMIHEILGHVPLFADPDFANFSQSIGFASLGASDDTIERLSRVYWYSVEFGLCRQSNGIKAYGAGILSSPGELEYALSKEPELLEWDPFKAAEIEFPITTYQPRYFVAENFVDVQEKLKKFMESNDRPFDFKYNPFTSSIQTFPRLGASMVQDTRIHSV